MWQKSLKSSCPPPLFEARGGPYDPYCAPGNPEISTLLYFRTDLHHTCNTIVFPTIGCWLVGLIVTYGRGALLSHSLPTCWHCLSKSRGQHFHKTTSSIKSCPWYHMYGTCFPVYVDTATQCKSNATLWGGAWWSGDLASFTSSLLWRFVWQQAGIQRKFILIIIS